MPTPGRAQPGKLEASGFRASANRPKRETLNPKLLFNVVLGVHMFVQTLREGICLES